MVLQEYFARVEWLFGDAIDAASGVKSAAKIYTSRNAIYYSSGVTSATIPEGKNPFAGPSTDQHISAGAIIGIVVGLVLIIGALGLTLYCKKRRTDVEERKLMLQIYEAQEAKRNS